MSDSQKPKNIKNDPPTIFMGAAECDCFPLIIPYEARYQTISAFTNHPSRCHLHECSIPPLFLCLVYLFYIYHFLVWKDLVLTIPRWSARNRRANRFVPLLRVYVHAIVTGCIWDSRTVLLLLSYYHYYTSGIPGYVHHLITSLFRAFNYRGLHIHCFVGHIRTS